MIDAVKVLLWTVAFVIPLWLGGNYVLLVAAPFFFLLARVYSHSGKMQSLSNDLFQHRMAVTTLMLARNIAELNELEQGDQEIEFDIEESSTAGDRAAEEDVG